MFILKLFMQLVLILISWLVVKYFLSEIQKIKKAYYFEVKPFRNMKYQDEIYGLKLGIITNIMIVIIYTILIWFAL